MALLPSFCCMAKEKESLDTISARRAFLEMPSGVLDLLSKDTRSDMLIYYDNDSIYKAKNNLDGVSFLETVTPDFISIRLTDASRMQLKVLKLKNGSEIVMNIYTTGTEGDSGDSDVTFYDSRLKPLDKEKLLPSPRLSDFFDTKGYKTKMKEIEEILPFFTVAYEAGPQDSSLKANLTYGDRLTVEDTKILELLLKPEITYQWNGKVFLNKK